MKKLCTKDLFNAMRFVKKANIKDEILPMFNKAEELVKQTKSDAEMSKLIEEQGFELIYKIMEIVTDEGIEEEFYRLLSNPFEMDADTIANMPLNEFFNCFVVLAKENNLKDFFTQVANLI